MKIEEWIDQFSAWVLFELVMTIQCEAYNIINFAKYLILKK